MEQLDELLQKLGGAPVWQKAVGLLVAVGLLGGGYWYFFLDDIWIQREQLAAEQSKLSTEKKEYENRKREYLAYRKEIAQLIEEQRDVLRLLPKKDDIEQFIEAMQQQIELSGLTRSALIRDPAVPQDLFIRLPIRMTVYGTYHQLMRFFKSMGEIPRIVNIEDLRLSPTESGSGGSGDKDLPPDTLKAEFVAVAYQYLDRAPARPAAGSGAGMQVEAQSSGGGGPGAGR